jgi:hypothetical protein
MTMLFFPLHAGINTLDQINYQITDEHQRDDSRNQKEHHGKEIVTKTFAEKLQDCRHHHRNHST